MARKTLAQYKEDNEQLANRNVLLKNENIDLNNEIDRLRRSANNMFSSSEVLATKLVKAENKNALFVAAIKKLHEIIGGSEIDSILFRTLAAHPELIEPNFTSQPSYNPVDYYLNPDQLREIQTHLKNGKFIPAIKYYREQTGWGLKESKEAVEKMRDEWGLKGR